MNTKNQHLSVSIVIIVIAIVVGVLVSRHTFKAPGAAPAGDSTVVTGDKTYVLACDAAKSLQITFHLPEDKSADVVTSGGQTVTLANTSSPNQASYTSADGKTVLALTNSTLALKEGNTVTYSNCVLATGTGDTTTVQ
jgi:membrane-bound inhibitor of C-type lysozyme